LLGATAYAEAITHAQLQDLPGRVTGLAAAPGIAAPAGWQPVDLTRADRLPDVLGRCRAIAARAGAAGGASLHNDLDWLLGQDPARAADLRLLTFEDGDAAGYAVFLVRTRPLKFQLGEITLAQVRLRYLTLSGEPLLAGPDGAARKRALSGFLGAARALLRPGDALAFEGVPVGGAFEALFDPAPAGFVGTRLGTPFDHQSIDMPADWAAYEAQLGTRSRKSLRYSRKKLA
jgi:hypothetical protein